MGGQPLIITDDEHVLGDLLRVAAAAGVEVTHAREPESAAVLWRTASMVIIDAVLVRRAVDATLARRPGVVVVAGDEPRAELWELCVRLGVDRTLALATSADVLIELLSDTVLGGAGQGRCLAVVGACGGAGASVLAGAIAFAAAAAPAESLLIDCDPWGAGLDVMLGIETEAGLRWTDLAAPSGRLQVEALRRALPGVSVGPGRVSVLCHGRAHGGERSTEIGPAALDVVLDAGRRMGSATVIDVPRQPGPAADRVLERADLIALVAPADVRGCWAADRVCSRIRQFGTRAGLVVRGPSPGGLGAAELAEVLGLPLLARMRADPSLARDLEVGLVLGPDRRRPLAKAARAVLASLRSA